MIAMNQARRIGTERPGDIELEPDPRQLHAIRNRDGDGEPSHRFAPLFRRLLDCWIEYQNASRHPSQFAKRAAARTALDDARSQIVAEGSQVVSTAALVSGGPQVAVTAVEMGKLRVAGIGHER